MFSKILVANRGEIAVRVIRACKEMGISSVAVYSEADRDALHVSLADESYCIGKPPARDSYLNANNIVSAALASKCEAIHPGYGFLAENHGFATLCGENGIRFIGPDPNVIAVMGDKDAARRTMIEAGVPVIPGSGIIGDADALESEAGKIGYPLLIKARSGGGGKGIRIAESAAGLSQRFGNAVSEALSAFGDGGVYLEKYLKPVKHIEMQILADNHGNVVCLGERDCSVQRKNQKLLEETPCIWLNDETRKKMAEVSVKAAKAVGYSGAGTLEYLCDMEGNFYFIEMNTRLQVEHPVTEMATGVDLVKWQIRAAAGMKLAISKDGLTIRGHAIECRINAEDPSRGFAPSAGRIDSFHVPGGPWVRFDTAIYQGYRIPPYYDSLIGKLIVYAATRDEAVRKMKAALCELTIEGIVNNADLQMDILSERDFEDGSYATDLLENLLFNI